MQPLAPPAAIQSAARTAGEIVAELDAMLLGRHDLHRLVLAGLLARGHILLEGLPGLGKTALVRALAEILQLSFKRVQFTPDLMPGDILGTHVLEDRPDGHREMAFRPGPVFCNLLLADEINRASPKTQSAMLETMQERTVTLLGTTRELPSPFLVLASQNPIELEGTYPLPEAQLDRFLFRLMVGALDTATIESILTTRRHGAPPAPSRRFDAEALRGLFAATDAVALPQAVAAYIARLVGATHPDSPEAPAVIRNHVTYGASPRAAIAIAEGARALALLAGRPTVGFEDVRQIAPHALNHRLILGYQARFEGVTPHAAVDAVLAALDPAGLDLPPGVQVAPPAPQAR